MSKNKADKTIDAIDELANDHLREMVDDTITRLRGALDTLNGTKKLDLIYALAKQVCTVLEVALDEGALEDDELLCPNGTIIDYASGKISLEELAEQESDLAPLILIAAKESHRRSKQELKKILDNSDIDGDMKEIAHSLWEANEKRIKKEEEAISKHCNKESADDLEDEKPTVCHRTSHRKLTPEEAKQAEHAIDIDSGISFCFVEDDEREKMVVVYKVSGIETSQIDDGETHVDKLWLLGGKLGNDEYTPSLRERKNLEKVETNILQRSLYGVDAKTEIHFAYTNDKDFSVEECNQQVVIKVNLDAI